MGFNIGRSSQKQKPVFWAGQREEYPQILNMMNAYMGLPLVGVPQRRQSYPFLPYNPYNPNAPYAPPNYPYFFPYNPNANYPNGTRQGGLFSGNTRTPMAGYTGTPTADNTGSEKTSVPGSDYLSRLLAGYQGQLSADLTPAEKDVLARIGAYKPSELYNTGKEQIMSTLKGEYNPLTSPYYKAMREQMQREGEEAVLGARQRANLYGQLSSTGMANVESRARARTANDINTLLGGMYENERARQVNAINQALAYEHLPQQILQQQLLAGQYERQVQQEALDRQYQEWLRQLQALGLPLEVALRLIGAPVATSSKGSGWNFGLNVMPIKK